MRDEPVVRNLIRSLAAAGCLLIAAFAVLPAHAQAPDPTEPKFEATPEGTPPAQPPPVQPPQAQPPHAQAPADSPPDTAEQRTKLLDELYARLAVSPNPEDAEPIVRRSSAFGILGQRRRPLVIARSQPARPTIKSWR
jgi:hypothetical protein